MTTTNPPITVRIRTAESGDWQDADSEHAKQYKEFLAQLLTSRNLVVLCGLGTSLCVEVKKGDGAPTMADLWSKVKEANNARFEQVLELLSWSGGEDVEGLLSHCQMRQELTPDKTVAAFIETGEKAIAKACDFVADDVELPVHEAFLRKVARRSTKLPRAQIFTTNYDLAFETAASRIGFAVIDGFDAASPPRFDPAVFERDLALRDPSRSNQPVDWIPNVVQIHKLHGSIDWARQGSNVRRETGVERPAIVYPRSSKFEASYNQPYLELMSRFQAALRRPDTGVIVAGVGFEDRHIAEPFLAAVRGNVGLSVAMISPRLESQPKPVAQALETLVKAGDRRIAMIAAPFAEAVAELPHLVGQLEQEVHAGRVQRLGDD